MGTSVRDWIRAVASFRMGISVSEVAFGEIYTKDRDRNVTLTDCPYGEGAKFQYKLFIVDFIVSPLLFLYFMLIWWSSLSKK